MVNHKGTGRISRADIPSFTTLSPPPPTPRNPQLRLGMGELTMWYEIIPAGRREGSFHGENEKLTLQGRGLLGFSLGRIHGERLPHTQPSRETPPTPNSPGLFQTIPGTPTPPHPTPQHM